MLEVTEIKVALSDIEYAALKAEADFFQIDIGDLIVMKAMESLKKIGTESTRYAVQKLLMGF